MARRGTCTPDIKARVVLEMLTDGMSLAEASRKYKIKDTTLSRWRQQFIKRAPQLFSNGRRGDEHDHRIAKLERMVGRLAVKLEASENSPAF